MRRLYSFFAIRSFSAWFSIASSAYIRLSLACSASTSRNRPRVIRCDNGPEYISGALLAWAEREGIRIEHIQPGKPQQNAYVERYNRTVRYAWLATTLFDTIEQVQNKATR